MNETDGELGDVQPRSVSKSRVGQGEPGEARCEGDRLGRVGAAGRAARVGTEASRGAAAQMSRNKQPSGALGPERSRQRERRVQRPWGSTDLNGGTHVTRGVAQRWRLRV